jgi:hypothetical protein
MVRSKVTAKKSTGAPAQRMTIPEVESKMKGARKVASTSKGKIRTRSIPEHSITNSITLTIQPDVPTNVLRVEVRGQVNPKADMDKDHDEVCSHFFLAYSTRIKLKL